MRLAYPHASVKHYIFFSICTILYICFQTISLQIYHFLEANQKQKTYLCHNYVLTSQMESQKPNCNLLYTITWQKRKTA